jgi:hypothetical protein
VTDDKVRTEARRWVERWKERDRAAGLSDTVDDPAILAELGQILADAAERRIEPARYSTRVQR